MIRIILTLWYKWKSWRFERKCIKYFGAKPENIRDVEYILQELDEFEWSYYPTGLVTSWDEYPRVDYVGKFELDKEKFQQICKERNIPVFVFDAEWVDNPSGYYPARPLNREEIKKLAFGELH